MRWIAIAALMVVACPSFAQPPKATPGNRLSYLDELDPYYPHAKFPKLITPQWIGEDGVEAVVILAIDDMREPAKYETFLRPILRRLQKIDGRAPVSIMTCSVNPKDPQLQTWLKEGLSIECHTIDHPCPFFKIGFEKAKSTYDRCVDLMNEIPGNKPVAFRMPCCDSLNTPSPRFWEGIFRSSTWPRGSFLSIDSSVFVYYSSDDPDLPKGLVLNDMSDGIQPSNPDLPESLRNLGSGRERFKRYLPSDRTFVNTIENYPYPYIIGNSCGPYPCTCWEFPCMTPSDWQAQHLQKPNNPKTVEDWKAALDCTVIKQGVMTMVFHPHGWIKNDQLVELIDYAVAKHGRKVKFLTFKEAEERINKNALLGDSIRDPKTGFDAGVYLIDLNDDGYLDVVLATKNQSKTLLWQPKARKWRISEFPVPFGAKSWRSQEGTMHIGFGLRASNEVVAAHGFHANGIGWKFSGGRWLPEQGKGEGFPNDESIIYQRLIDLDGDGTAELLLISKKRNFVFRWDQNKGWKRLPFSLPYQPPDRYDWFDPACRLLDLDGDGKLDIVFSNYQEYGIYLFTDMEKGWSRKILAGKRGALPASAAGALRTLTDGQNNHGFWVHSGYLWWSNEDTALLKDHVDRRKIADLLKSGVK